MVAMLLLPIALADDRWLEDTADPAVVAWAMAKDAEARAWIADRGEVEALRTWAEGWAKHVDRREVFVHDAVRPSGEELRVYRTWSTETDASGDRRTRTTLVVRTQHDERALVGDLDDTHMICTATLERGGRYEAWGRLLASGGEVKAAAALTTAAPTNSEQPPCRLYVTDLADGRTWTVFEGPELGATFSPDATRLLVTHRSDGVTRVEELLLDGTPVAQRLRSRSRLSARWLADGNAFVTSGGAGASWNRLAWGPPEHLDWLGNLLFWPPYGRYSWVGQDGDALLLRTDVDAPNFRVVRVDPRRPFRADWETIVPEDPSSILADARRVGDRLLQVRRVDGAEALLSSPLADPTATLSTGVRASQAIQLRGNDARATVSALSVEGKRTYTLDAGGLTLTEEEARLATFSTEYATSADGTEVPVSVVRPPNVAPGAPAWVEVYGGFGQSPRAQWKPQVQRWLELGGIYAVIHARGGDERGEAWHEAAMRTQKVRTFDDVVAASEWLTKHGSAPGRVVLVGASNGGLTVTAAVARRPELFGAVIASSGVYDLMRGPAMGNWWPNEYGRPRGPKVERAALAALSPLLAVPAGKLPPILLITGREDRRVTPAHSYKLASAWAGLPGGPVLLRVTPYVSHPTSGDNLGTPPDAWAALWAENLAFVLRALGMSSGG